MCAILLEMRGKYEKGAFKQQTSRSKENPKNKAASLGSFHAALMR